MNLAIAAPDLVRPLVWPKMVKNSRFHFPSCSSESTTTRTTSTTTTNLIVPMELPAELWKQIFGYLNPSDCVNFLYCLLGEERWLKIPGEWTVLLDFMGLSINFEDSFEKQRKDLRASYTTYLRDRLGANIDNYMNDEHLCCFQCNQPLSISIIPLDANREGASRMTWNPEGLKEKKKKEFNYDNTHSEAQEFFAKNIDAEWMGEVKSVIFSKQCVKCNISAHFERSSYCSNCHKEEFPVMICGCSRGYCVLCFFPQLTQTPKINGFCYTCNRLICDQCSSCCHFIDINCYKRFCHRCEELCEFCGMETSCNQHGQQAAWRESLCFAPRRKNIDLYYSGQSTENNN